MTTGRESGPVATVRQPASSETPTHLPPSTQPQMLLSAAKSIRAIGPALGRLSAMKNHVELTPFALETWAAVLGQYELPVVNEAVLRIGLSDDPFPDLGKLVMRCEAIRRQRANVVTQVDKPQLSTAMIGRVAQALGLDV